MQILSDILFSESKVSHDRRDRIIYSIIVYPKTMVIKKEIKLKARIFDIGKTEKKVKTLAEYKCRENVTDYFLSRENNKYEEIRLRNSEKGGEVIMKIISSLGKFQENEEYKFAVDNKIEFTKFIEKIGFKISASLKKRTRVYESGEIAIRLSEVEGLGDYIEIMGECFEGTEEKIRNRIKEIKESIGILDSEIDNRYYGQIKAEQEEKFQERDSS